MERKLQHRLGVYLEIGLVSIVWLGLLVLATWVLARKVIEDSDQTWTVILALTPIFLLPYFVVAANVWGVNLRALGAGGERVIPEPRPEKVELRG